MRKILLPVLIFLAPALFAQQQKTILAIFAHPDDESAIGEVLVKYAASGHKVIVMIATDGNNGTRVTSIPAGDSLGKLRRQETICACNKMGLQPPVFLGLERLDTQIGVGKYFNNHKSLRQALRQHIASIRPDLILTFGPDGDTHHSEHIVIGGAVTELLLEQGWVDRYPLYYLAWTKGDGVNDLGIVDSSYLNVRFQFSQEEEDIALSAFPCYVTQFTPKEIEEDRERKLGDKENAYYFRRFVVQKGIHDDFFVSASAGQTNKSIENQVLQAGRNYNSLMITLRSGMPYQELINKGYMDQLDKILTEEYIYTSRDGKTSGKKASFDEYRNHGFTSYSAEILDQEVRLLVEGSAVETGTIRFKGIKAGKPFGITKRYTTTWVWRDGRWQIVADHTSAVVK